MIYAADFRSVARAKLSGRWTKAVLAGLVASLLGGVASNGSQVSFTGGDSIDGEIFEQLIKGLNINSNEQILGKFLAAILVIGVFALITTIFYILIGCIVSTGYAKFNLDLVDSQKEPEIGTLFGHFKHWKITVSANLLRGVYVFLGLLLFVLPGIIMAYNYAMTNYIVAEHPELTASEALRQSKQMMRGNRMRLIWLELSFIGWEILCALTLGIGNLWLTPYKQAAIAVFYREVSGTRVRIPYGEDADNNLQN